MSQFPSPFSARRQPLDYTQAEPSQLASFFNSVYAWMAAGLALTAVVAWYVSTQPQLVASTIGPMWWVFGIAEVGLVIAITAGLNRMSAAVATVLFLAFAALNGLTLSVIFLIYTHATLASAFFITAGTFGVMSVYGMVTKADLSRLGTLLFMGLIGIVIASIVNIFVHSTGLEWIISYAGVALFIGLTAFDTQRLKMLALQYGNDPAATARFSVYGALVLYLDFINLFIFILQIMGNNGGGRRR